MRLSLVNYSWVIPGSLCGLALPGRLRPLRADLQELKEAGVTLVVSAMSPALAPGSLSAFEMTGLHVPIREFTAARQDQLESFVARARTEIEGGGAVAVHCFAGMGRTGMLLAAYLAAHYGFRGDGAIEHLRQLRPGSIETLEQEDAVREFVRRLGSRPR